MTTQCNESFCGQCEELLGLQNSLWDDGVEHFVPWGPKARNTLLKRMVKLGGNQTAVIAYMPDLFGNGRFELPKAETL